MLDASLYTSGWKSNLLAFCDGLRPDPPLWIDQWADAHMVIPKESGAAEPGRYRVSRTPYAREVMRALSPEHPALKVVVKGASQLLKTQVALNFAAAVIDRQPANLILLEPTDSLARRVASRFDKVVQVVEPLRNKVAQRKDRDSKNTGDTKEFKGGTAWFLSARSASNLAEASARYLIVDEVDRLLRELKGEGDPIGLGEKRQTTYGRKAKGLYISSPTEEDSSRIDELFRSGNQHVYHVPCPHCGELQSLEWEQFHYEETDGQVRAWMVCKANGCMIEEHHKPSMLPDESMGGRARWEPMAKGNGEVWSYEISSLYAPLGWVSWVALAREYMEAEKALQQGDDEKMRVFYNTRLARCYSPTRAKVQPQALKDRAEAYPLGIVPPGAYVLTASADVQGNRLECQILGWGPGPTGLEAWVIATHIIYGDPALPETWAELDAILSTPIQRAEGGYLHIRAAAVDSGDGDSTIEVYEFCRPRKTRFLSGQPQNVLAVKGASQANRPVIGKPSKIDYNYRGRAIHGGVELWQVGTDTAKDWILKRLGLEGQTAIHTSQELPLEWYEQALSEAKISRWERGKKRTRYQLLRRGSRNEQLDMLVYNLAMAHRLGLDRYTAQRWSQVAAQVAQADVFAEIQPAPKPAQQPAVVKDSLTTETQPAALPRQPPAPAKPNLSSSEWSSRL
jgi:phage terminase large subunit GpA-like protein